MKIFAIFFLISLTSSQQIPDDICEGINLGFLEYPDDCVQFILCVLEEPSFHRCTRPGEIFDVENGACVPGDPVTCEIFTPSPETTTTADFPTLPTISPTPTLPTVPSPTLPTTTTVAIGTTPQFTTPSLPGLTTPSLPSQTPTLPSLPGTTTVGIGTSPSPITTPTFPTPTFPPPPSTTTVGIGSTPGPETSTVPSNDPICRGNNLRFVADPQFCFRYFYCFFGVPFAGECDPTRIFVQVLQACVRGDWETCTINVNS